MKSISKPILLFIIMLSAILRLHAQVAQHVNPFIGTGGHGHTFPGATVPFGMVQLSPDTRIDGSWDGCSGYHYSDSIIYGFSHTHLSGTGVSDYGDIAVLPYAGNATVLFSKNMDYKKINVAFNHKNEKASAGYYSVNLNNQVQAELTATPRCGFHKYNWPVKTPRSIIIKITHRDETILSDIQVSADKKKITGFRRSNSWARDQHVYFSMEFSEEFKLISTGEFKVHDDNDEHKLLNTARYIVLEFKKQKKQKALLVKTGLSQVSIEGARKNLAAEIPHWDFEKTKTEAKNLWNTALDKIQVTSTDKDKLTVFYTALYHCMIHPNIANDVDGNYRGRDNQIHHADHDYYTVFSLWDTFRALHPLLTIIDRKRTNDFIKTFLLQYQQGGRLPVWELSSNETDCMIGYHSTSVITDAYVKGIYDYDANLAMEAMQKSANWNHLGLPAYTKKGFLETDDEHESVSKTLEYGYDDWCISQFAKSLGRKEHANLYSERSLAWRNLFDPETKFIRPRSNGGWLTPFNPNEVNNHYTEANGWQYNFFVPHDMNNLILAMGGEKKFGEKLDSLFFGSSKTTGRDQADITGLIGQYAHGNEPSHHMAYLYTFAAQPWKTQELVHKICNEFYKNTPDGLIGNEDCGQMSAWYVFNALGFYPVCPGSPEYVFGTPMFEKTVLNLENGKNFTITAKGVSAKNFYLKDVDYYYVKHDNISTGGSLSFNMTSEPQKNLIYVEGYRTPKLSVDSKFTLPAPVINASGRVFRDSMQITITRSGYRFAIIEYKEWNSSDSSGKEKAEWKRYEKPFTIKSDREILAVAYGPEKESRAMSAPITARFHKIPHNWSVEIKGKYNAQYSAGGTDGLIDGLLGDVNWRKGYWQGYQNQDFECIIDLKKPRIISEAGVRFLKDSRSWILLPKKIEVYVSEDGVNFKKISDTSFDDDPLKEHITIHNVIITVENSTEKFDKWPVRYVKIMARNFGKLPPGHLGYSMNGDAFIFVDEVWVK